MSPKVTPSANSGPDSIVDDSDENLVARIEQSRRDGGVVQTSLTTDKRVLARVTDGIYRQPGSALRELISNAFDADAKNVLVHTDRPRFKRIAVRDDGNGMSVETLSHMIRHIGGSAKRSASGAGLNVTDAHDPTLSPGGRYLIGRLGIGLFSVSQLTQGFQIVTKSRDVAWRSVASVRLNPYSEPGRSDESETVTTGTVRIWQEPATDAGSHGTSIILDSIRPAALKTLRSSPDWQRVAVGDKHAVAPRFHVGQYSASDDVLVAHDGALNELPWARDSDAEGNFKRLVDAVWNELYEGERNPRLDRLFDNYLQMVWGLALAIPGRYVDGHPFDIPLGKTDAYELPGGQPGPARALNLKTEETVRHRLELPPAGNEGQDFKVQVDDLVLRRPLKFVDLPTTSHAIKHPLLFVGGLREEFHGLDREVTGGPLEFQAYFMWTPKIAPVEHNGVLIRLHGASGTLFDPSFLNFKLAELTRLRQITCEVFVTEGLESALNIDRESFNTAHPHTVRLTRWLHAALARVFNQQKQIAARIHRETRNNRQAEHLSELDEIIENLWDEQGWDGEPSVMTWGPSDREGPGFEVNRVAFDRDAIVGSSPKSSAAALASEARLLAIARVLDAFDLLDELESPDRDTLLRYVLRVLNTET